MAIKVNGTTVIDDSRALSNITSVDATTATAFGNAGVGGLSKVVATDASMGTGSSLSFTLGDYQTQHFYFDGFFKHNATSGARQFIRLSDSSGNSITDSEYCSIGRFGDYSSNYTYDSYLFNIGGSDINNVNENTRYFSLHITVRDAYSSTKRTKWEITYKYIKTDSLTNNSFQHNNGLMLNAEKNNSIIFTLEAGRSFTENGVKYSSIGVN